MGVFAAAVVGYLMGSLPSADIATRLATDGSVDLRTAGSGNPGAANAKDVLGAKWGAAVMTADIAKGAVACVAGRGLGGDLGAHVGGTAAVVGHCFPVWNGFRGGKGFASAVGQVATTFPAFLPAGIGVVGATVSVPWKSRSTAVTLAGAISWVVAAMLWWRKGWRNGFGPKPTVALPLAAAATSAVVLYRFANANEPAAVATGGITADAGSVR
jgi:acyl phosphate:glycerol-3-phosphate acyltransferase